jgi:cell division protein FtsB
LPKLLYKEQAFPDMAIPLEPKLSARREHGPEPLRRKRVQPVAPASPLRNKVIARLLIFATVVLLVDSLVGDKGLIERLHARRSYAEMEASLNDLKARNASLRKYAQDLKENRDTIEAIAREELGMTRSGEILFIVRDAKPQSN